MHSEVRTQQVESIPFAAVLDRANLQDLPTKVGHNVNTVLQFLERSHMEFGRCIVMYSDVPGTESLLASQSGVPIHVGWEVTVPFNEEGSGVARASTPGGMAASIVHTGPFEDLPQTHSAIRGWCLEHDLNIDGTSWEIYDHPREGQPQRTEIFYSIPPLNER